MPVSRRISLRSINFLTVTFLMPTDHTRTSELEMQGDLGMALVWQDEFTGGSLDASKWEIEEDALGGGNNELQIYTKRHNNVRIEDNHLVIEARHDKPELKGERREYSSGRIRTKYKGDWTYGRVVVRAELPAGAGIWPAIWMLPTDNAYGGWAASGEIDIVEMKGQHPELVYGTLHYGGAWPHHKHSGERFSIGGESFADDFHVFEVEWREGSIQWFVDGVLYQTQTSWYTDNAPFPAPFDKRFHLVINVAVGGNFPGPPDESTVFPSKMLVDYVRVYQYPS